MIDGGRGAPFIGARGCGDTGGHGEVAGEVSWWQREDDERRVDGVASGRCWTTGKAELRIWDGRDGALVRGEVSLPQRRDDGHPVDAVAGGAPTVLLQWELDNGNCGERIGSTGTGKQCRLQARGSRGGFLFGRRVVTRPTAPRGGDGEARLLEGSGVEG